MGVYPNRLNQGALCIKNDWTFRILLPPRARMHARAPKMPSLHRIHVKKAEFYHCWRPSLDCRDNKCWLKGQQMLTGRKFEMSPLHRTWNRFHTTNTAWNSSIQNPSKFNILLGNFDLTSKKFELDSKFFFGNIFGNLKIEFGRFGNVFGNVFLEIFWKRILETEIFFHKLTSTWNFSEKINFLSIYTKIISL